MASCQREGQKDREQAGSKESCPHNLSSLQSIVKHVSWERGSGELSLPSKGIENLGLNHSLRLCIPISKEDDDLLCH